MILDSVHLNIGPIRFVLSTDGSGPPRYDGTAHADFLSPAAGPGAPAPMAELAVHIERGNEACPSSPALFTVGANWSVWSAGDDWTICTGCADRERPRVSCRVAKALDKALLLTNGGPEDAPLRYPLDQILSWGLLGKCGGILLHAAAVEYNGAGLVFAGRSGAGKSTLSGFCHQQGWEILNDDRVMLYPDPEGAGWLVAGTPWHGSGRFARNQKLPLKRVCVLQQDTSNWVEPLSPREARYALLDVAGIAWFEETWSQQALDALGRLTGEVGVVRYHFTRSAQAVDALQALL